MNDIDKIFEDWDELEFEDIDFQIGDMVFINPMHFISESSNFSGISGKVIEVNKEHNYPILVTWGKGANIGGDRRRYYREELLKFDEFYCIA